MKLPKDWSEITLAQYQELLLLPTVAGVAKTVHLLSILASIDEEEMKKLKTEDVTSLVSSLSFISTTPPDDFVDELLINGTTYKLVEMKDLTLGEWIDIETFCEDYVSNLHKLIAIFYRPEGEEYDYAKMEQRAELFETTVTIGNCYGVALFFSRIGMKFILSIQDSLLQQEKQMMEEMKILEENLNKIKEEELEKKN